MTYIFKMKIITALIILVQAICCLVNSAAPIGFDDLKGARIQRNNVWQLGICPLATNFDKQKEVATIYRSEKITIAANKSVHIASFSKAMLPSGKFYLAVGISLPKTTRSTTVEVYLADKTKPVTTIGKADINHTGVHRFLLACTDHSTLATPIADLRLYVKSSAPITLGGGAWSGPCSYEDLKFQRTLTPTGLTFDFDLPIRVTIAGNVIAKTRHVHLRKMCLTTEYDYVTLPVDAYIQSKHYKNFSSTLHFQKLKSSNNTGPQRYYFIIQSDHAVKFSKIKIEKFTAAIYQNINQRLKLDDKETIAADIGYCIFGQAATASPTLITRLPKQDCRIIDGRPCNTITQWSHFLYTKFGSQGIVCPNLGKNIYDMQVISDTCVEHFYLYLLGDIPPDSNSGYSKYTSINGDGKWRTQRHVYSSYQIDKEHDGKWLGRVNENQRIFTTSRKANGVNFIQSLWILPATFFEQPFIGNQATIEFDLIGIDGQILYKSYTVNRTRGMNTLKFGFVPSRRSASKINIVVAGTDGRSTILDTIKTKTYCLPIRAGSLICTQKESSK